MTNQRVRLFYSGDGLVINIGRRTVESADEFYVSRAEARFTDTVLDGVVNGNDNLNWSIICSVYIC